METDGRAPRGNRTVDNRIIVLRALSLVISVAALVSAAPATAVYRFLDQTKFPAATLKVRGDLKRVLSPMRIQEIFELPHQPGVSTLDFSIGLQPTKEAGTIRFVIELARDKVWRVLYSKELSEPGWVDERVALPADLGRRRLRFRRRRMSGSAEHLRNSGFGDPILLPAELAKRPSVILISLDTLRADRLGLAGYAKARTPVLDAFGRSGIWYTDAYSPSAWTLPSHASLFYGQLVQHVPDHPLGQPAEALSLAEVLRASGYLTAAFTGGGYVSSQWGFATGFDTYFSFPQSKADFTTCSPQRFDGPEVFRRATAWLRNRGQAPFFIFLHTYDVHDRCPFQAKTKGRAPWDTLDEAGHARLLSYYDDLIAETDTRVGAFLHEIDALGLRDRTLIVITSDHGELFNEHGERGHGCKSLFEPLIRVPLLVRYPARVEPRAPGRSPVSLTDVAPTILALLDLPRPNTMTGRPLPGLGTGDRGTRPVLVGCGDYVAVRQEGLKLMASRQASAQHRLCDLERDPHEMANLFKARPKAAEPLLRQAEEYWQTVDVHDGKPPPRELDPETKERLRALGYDP